MLAEPADHAPDDHGVSFSVARPLEERVDHATGRLQRQRQEAPHGRSFGTLAADGDEVLQQPLACPVLERIDAVSQAARAEVEQERGPRRRRRGPPALVEENDGSVGDARRAISRFQDEIIRRLFEAILSSLIHHGAIEPHKITATAYTRVKKNKRSGNAAITAI